MNDFQMQGIELRARRLALGLSQAQLGQCLGNPQATVSAWEKDTRTIPPGMMFDLINLEDEVMDLLLDLVDEAEEAAALNPQRIKLVTHAHGTIPEGLPLAGLPVELHQVACAQAVSDLVTDGVDAAIVTGETGDLTTGMAPIELKARRLALGLPQHVLATQLGTQQATISNWEKGKRPIPAGISAELSELEQAVEELADMMTSAVLRADNSIALITHETDAGLSKAHPEMDGLPVELHQVACARTIVGLRIEDFLTPIISGDLPSQ